MFLPPFSMSWTQRSKTFSILHKRPISLKYCSGSENQSVSGVTTILPSALYSENRDSSVKRTPLQSARRHRMWAFAHSSQLWQLQSGRDPDEDDENADELPWDGFWQFVQIFFGYANRLLQQLSGWLVSDDLGGEDAGCGGPGLVWLHVVCGCEAGWMYCQILWNAFGR